MILAEDPERALTIHRLEDITDGLHKAVMRVTARHAEDGWGTRPALYILSGPEEAEPVPTRVPMDPRIVGLADTGTVLCEAMSYAIQTAGQLSMRVGTQIPLPYHGHLVVEEGWGLWGEAARREAEVLASGRRRIPIRDRPDRIEVRSICTYTVTGRLVTVLHRREHPPILNEAFPAHIEHAMSLGTLARAVAELTKNTARLLTLNGLMGADAPR